MSIGSFACQRGGNPILSLACRYRLRRVRCAVEFPVPQPCWAPSGRNLSWQTDLIYRTTLSRFEAPQPSISVAFLNELNHLNVASELKKRGKLFKESALIRVLASITAISALVMMATASYGHAVYVSQLYSRFRRTQCDQFPMSVGTFKDLTADPITPENHRRWRPCEAMATDPTL